MKWAVLALFASPALAQPTAFESCVGCHGPTGAAKGFPLIDGQPAPYIERQLEAYADGRREHEVMTPIARNLTGEQRRQLAAHFSSLPKKSQGEPRKAAPPRGRELAMRGDDARRVQACRNCHGPGGIGQAPSGPHLAGLDAAYLREEMQEFGRRARRTDPSNSMEMIASNLSRSDMAAVAQYYAAQPIPRPRASGAKAPARPPAAPTKEGMDTKRSTDTGPQGPGGGD